MRLILIGGAQRSGTTLLQTLVANALDAPVLPESHILCDILAAYKRAKDAGQKTRYFYGTDAALLAFFQSCATRHIADIAETIGAKSVLVLKDPNLVQVDAEAAAIFPDAIRIVCLRDPRDIAASFLRIGQKEQPKGQPGKYRRRDIDFIGKKILGSYAPLMRGDETSSLHLVRYEDVAANPRETLQKLARATGLVLSLERTDNPVWLDADARHEASWISELEGRGPSSASVGAYKTVMRPNEIALTEQICSPYMAWAGYERSAAGASPARWSLTGLRHLVRWIKRRYWSFRERLTQL